MKKLEFIETITVIVDCWSLGTQEETEIEVLPGEMPDQAFTREVLAGRHFQKASIQRPEIVFHRDDDGRYSAYDMTNDLLYHYKRK